MHTYKNEAVMQGFEIDNKEGTSVFDMLPKDSLYKVLSTMNVRGFITNALISNRFNDNSLSPLTINPKLQLPSSRSLTTSHCKDLLSKMTKSHCYAKRMGIRIQRDNRQIEVIMLERKRNNKEGTSVFDRLPCQIHKVLSHMNMRDFISYSHPSKQFKQISNLLLSNSSNLLLNYITLIFNSIYTRLLLSLNKLTANNRIHIFLDMKMNIVKYVEKLRNKERKLAIKPS